MAGKKGLSLTLLTILVCALCALCLFACGKEDGYTQLSAPQNLRIENDVLIWDEVEGAKEYEVEINDERYKTDAARLDVFLITDTPIVNYKMSVRVSDGGRSEWSDAVDYSIPTQLDHLKFAKTEDGEYVIAEARPAFISGKLILPKRFPDGQPITKIADTAFKSCAGLTGIIIPDTVKEIGAGAFSLCTSLTSVKLPAGLTRIYPDTFNGCAKLTEVDLPEGVEQIGNRAFEGCKSLTEITLPDGVKQIGNSAFEGCKSLSKIALPDGVKQIGSMAFAECSSLAEFKLPASVHNFSGERAFKNCDALTKISVDEENSTYKSVNNCIVRISGAELVAVCKSSVIPDEVKTIGVGTFSECDWLTDVTVPGSVERINGRAFYKCNSLKKVTVESGVKVVMAAFSYCAELEEVSLPDTVTKIYTGLLSGCNKIKRVTVDSNNPTYKSESNCIISKSDNALTVGCFSSKIPDYVECIDKSAFEGVEFKHITVRTDANAPSVPGTLELPVGLKKLNSGSFMMNNRLESVQLPDGLLSVGEHAFGYCGALTYVFMTDKCNADIDRTAFETGTIYTSHTERGNFPRSTVLDCTFAQDGNGPFVDSFVMSKNQSFDSYDTLFIPYREGYAFAGWAPNSRESAQEEIITPSTVKIDKDADKNAVGMLPKSSAFISGEQMNKVPENTRLYALWTPVENA